MKSNALRLIIPVVLTCMAAAAGLSATYTITAPLIAAQEKAAEEAALKSVLPDAASFEAVDAEMLASAQQAVGESKVSAIYRALDASGATVGWGLKVGSRGYGGSVDMVWGLDRDGKVTDLTILTMNETPGLGTRIKTEPGFLEQYRGLSGGFTEKDVKKLDMISGATKSSRAVRNSGIAVSVVYETVLKAAGEVR
ncbi:MAG: FMN-binding protein [Actinobacteria bacterium]|nr:MAG: FMN-binding protein [Actinomycetota bacterium]